MAKQSKDALLAAKDIKAFRRKNPTGYGASRKVYVMDPDDVVQTIRLHIRTMMGDWMENNAKVFGTRGFFYIKLPYRRPLNVVEDDFWRQVLREGINLRRVSVGLAIRAMHGEVLTDV